jgi:hypothetical protein
MAKKPKYIPVRDRPESKSSLDTPMRYPDYDHLRVGRKVSWYIYKDRALAEQASVAANHNKIIGWRQGYDYGYCDPGSITQLADGRYEVCIP